jgi:glycosyltransferase involved in cell wall biosynthesis
MKILVTMNLPYLRCFGGANRSNRSLAEGLAAMGHQMRVIVPAFSTPSHCTHQQFLGELREQGIAYESSERWQAFRINGVEVIAVREASQLRKSLTDNIVSFRPDWTLVSSEDPSQSLLAGALEHARTRVVYLAHTPQMLPFGPASLYPGEARTELVKKTAGIVAISNFVAEYVTRWTGREVFINHPPHYGEPAFQNYGERSSGYVLLMNPCAVKGISIFLSLARALPQVQFAAVPGWGTTCSDRLAMERLANIRLLRNSRTLNDILVQTKILLMPSLWPEGFGMATVDAMLREIPVLASDCGGLREAKLGTDFLLPVHPIEQFRWVLDEVLLPTPVVPEQDITPWRSALEELLSDPAGYQIQSSISRQVSSHFVSRLTCVPFQDYLVSLAETSQREGGQALSGVGVKGRAETAEKGQACALPAQLSELTPEQCALLILRLQKRRLVRAAQATADIPLRRFSRDREIPLSYAQQRLWLIDKMEPGNTTNNLLFGLRLKGELNKQVVRNCINTIVSRHEILRTRFPERQGIAIQQILEESSVRLNEIDLRELPTMERERAARKIAEEEAATAFNLKEEPTLRVKLLEIGDHDHVLLVGLHHIASDGWSVGVMIREFASLYEVECMGKPPRLPELPIQYADFSEWQREWLRGEVVESRLRYWRKQMEGASAELHLPQKKPRPRMQSFRGSRYTVVLSSEMAGSLHGLSQREGTTLFMTVLAGFAVLLYQYSGQDNLLIGSVIANRDRVETENLIGFLANTLVLRLDLSRNPTFREILNRVKVMCLEAYANQVPLEKLMEELAHERGSERQRLYDVWFQMDSPSNATLTLPGLQCEQFQVERTDAGAKFELSLELSEEEWGIAGHIEYDSDVFEKETIAQMRQHLKVVLQEMVEDPERNIADLTLASQQESEQLASAFSGTLEE